MSCRRITNNHDGKRTIVWFGSLGAANRAIVNLHDTLTIFYAREDFNQAIYLDDSLDRELQDTNELTLTSSTDITNIYYTPDGHILSFHDNDTCTIDNVLYTMTETSTDHYDITDGTNSGTIEVQHNVAEFYDEADKHNNYSTGLEAVRNCLIQRLSIIKGELWYNMSFGQPLLDKNKHKDTFDAHIVAVVLQHPDVKEIKQFDSKLEGHSYYCKLNIMTKYGDVIVNI